MVRELDALQSIRARLRDGEKNPWLVYEACKVIQPESLDDLLQQLPGADWRTVAEGWLEWRSVPEHLRRAG